MNRFTLSGIATAILIALTATQSQAVITYGPNGTGGFNAYERVNAAVNYSTAITNSQIGFPGSPLFNLAPQPGVIGHLANFSSSLDYEYQAVTLRAGASANVYIGLTDNVAFTPAAFEGGNTSGGALPVNGVNALAGQRGAGFAFVGVNTLNQFHQRTPGVSIWGGGEPNGSGGENVAEIRGDGFLNDIGEGNTRPYIREWDLNLPTLPTVQAGLTGFKVTDMRNVGGVNNGNYKTIAAAPPVGASISLTLEPVLNFGGGGNFGGDLSFPQGGGDNFVIVAEGFVEIPTAGAWTFQVNQDDPVFVQIGTNGAPQSFEDLGCCDTTRVTLTLDQGIFPIKVVFAEFGGGENLELAAAFGANVTNGAAFRLVGDTANGGLRVVTIPVPEPATAMLGMLGMSLLGLRRRRVA